MAKDNYTQNLFFVDVGGATDELSGRPFDGLVPGEFVDMWGSEVRITKRDLKQFVKNTQDAIDATTTESGEVVGLPIDPHDHNRGDAAGWIVGVDLVNDVIRFTPRWTEIGIDLISKGVKRFFSATLNLKNKIILGGTLTNWPATRDDVGKILLRPIELSASSNWVANNDKSTWVATDGVTSGSTNVFIPAIVTVDDQADENEEEELNLNEGDEKMTLEFESMDELKEVIRGEIGDSISDAVGDAVTAAFANLEMPQPDQDDGETDDDAGNANDADLLAQFDLQDMPEQVIDALDQQMLKQYEIIKKRASDRAAQMIANIKHEDDVKDFVQASTAGTESIPRGLPVDPEKLNAFALSLNSDQYKFFSELVETTLDRGFEEFVELGHGKGTKGTRELPDIYKEMLDSKEIELQDLRDPMVAPDLGDLSDYNLSAYQS